MNIWAVFSKMNYGIVVCKLKPFEPPEYRLTVAARCGVEGGPSWWVRDLPVTVALSHPALWPRMCVPTCSLPQFLSEENYTYISHRLNLLMFGEQHLIHEHLKDNDLFCCRTLSIRFLGKLKLSDKLSKCFAQAKNIYPLLIEKKPPQTSQNLPLE